MTTARAREAARGPRANVVRESFLLPADGARREQIAAYDWNLARLMEIHLRMSEEMNREVAFLDQLDSLEATADVRGTA